MQAYGFWVKVFALSFALGVVSGVTMSFQFGTNWPGYMNTVGNIAGPLLAYEVLTAFFLEATFLGVMLFGRDRVSEQGAYARHLPRRRRHDLVGLLDPVAEFLDADARRLRNDRRQGACTRLDGGRSSIRPCRTGSRTCCWLRASPPRFLVAGISAYQWLRGDRGAGGDGGNARRGVRGGAA